MTAIDNRRREDPGGIPPKHLERLGLRFCIDNNIIGDLSPAVVALRESHRDGWINLQRTDTIDTELADTKDEDKRRALLDESAQYVESHGPAFFDHSRFDHCVFAGNDDDERHLRVYRIFFPDSDRHDASSNAARRKFRDAMHVATAVRYGCSGFITRDDAQLRKADQIASAFNGFLIMSPEDALDFVRRQRRNYDIRNPT